jgi:arsenite-transporting ATPase
MSTLSELIETPTRVLFFTGKGGMGKTTLACATAVALVARGLQVLIVSTDPASNLDEVLGTSLGEQPRPVARIAGLHASNIDPEAAAREYRERAVGPYRGLLPDSALSSMEESLSGACTVEIAAFDTFAALLGDTEATAGYDHVIFDTAPTGHTLRLLALPAAWSGFIDTNTSGVSCLGPLAGLQDQRDLYAASVRALGDPHLTTLVLVSRPERTALAEAERTRAELAGAGMRHQVLALNGTFDAADSDDDTAVALAQRQGDALAAVPSGLAELPRVEVPLLDFAPIGPDALARVLDPAARSATRKQTPDAELPGAALSELIDELEIPGRGVIMTMGKGGVGKTTLAAAIANELARRGHPVHLSTTDPAAHVADAVGDGVPGLSLSRIDPAEQTRTYSEQVLAAAGPDLDDEGRALLEEDLRSPCTEEIAVFRAFADVVSRGQDDFVVLDTAPTGHSLLLLDATQSYHRDVARGLSEVPDAVAQLLPRLRDPEYTRVLIVALPEATPVHEAARLSEDLERAGITPYAWIVNQSLAAAGAEHPTLAARARDEHPYLAEAAAIAQRLALVPWQPHTSAGNQGLRTLVGA